MYSVIAIDMRPILHIHFAILHFTCEGRSQSVLNYCLRITDREKFFRAGYSRGERRYSY
jgi:hypothetical protein